jgi:hypothetical protein
MTGTDLLDESMPSTADFPKGGTSAAQLRSALRWAILAPSSHNTQPWLFRIEGHCVEVYADRTRALPVVDPYDRELTISCGAAVQTLVVALAGLGLRSDVDVFPDSTQPDLVATVRLVGPYKPSEEDVGRLAAITRRCSNRGPFTDDGLTDNAIERFKSVVSFFGASLHVASINQKAALGRLIAESDRVQMADARFRRELSAWVHSNRSSRDDGLRGYSTGVADVASALMPLIVRTFDVGRGQAAKDLELATESPMLAVLSVPTDTEIHWIDTGRALAQLLLEVTSFGLAASFLNQPIEVASHRREVAEIMEVHDATQLVLRIGAPTQTFRHTPRRRLGDVIASARE